MQAVYFLSYSGRFVAESTWATSSSLSLTSKEIAALTRATFSTRGYPNVSNHILKKIIIPDSPLRRTSISTLTSSFCPLHLYDSMVFIISEFTYIACVIHNTIQKIVKTHVTDGPILPIAPFD
jgi:hypothetical protein